MKVEVPPEGSRYAKVILIGEAPAKEEVLTGRPFQGSAGRYLNRFLRLAGLRRNELYITNVSKNRAPKDTMSLIPFQELEMWRKRLIDELNGLFEPKILVPLGRYALESVTDKKGISNFRGSILTPRECIRHKCIVVPTLHPSVVHYNYSVWPLIVADLARVRKLAESDVPYEPPTFNFIIRPTFQQVIDTLEMLKKANFPMVVIDVETPHDRLSAIGLAWSRRDAISIPFYYGTGRDYWTLEQEAEIWKKLAEVLPQLNLANQNVFFDWRILYEHNIRLKTPTWDPMLMHHCLYPELPHRLDVITSIYTDIPFYKKDEKGEKGSTLRAGMERDHWIYNCYDVVAAFWSIENLRKELAEEGLIRVYIDLYAEMIEPLLEMNLRGVPVDVEQLKEARKVLKKLIEDYTQEIYEQTGCKLNVNSPKQVSELLFGTLNMQPYKGEKTGKKALKKLAYKYQSDIPTMIIDIRAARKELSLFSEENVVDGRVRCDYSLARTSSGRLASRKAFSRGGMNLQNVKRGEQRKFFVAEKGHILVGGDQKQAEARIVGWYARDRKFLDLFAKGKSIHLENAKNIFGEYVEKDDPRYVISKSLIHGSNYGLSAFTFARIANIPLADAKRHLELYHSTYPGIRKVFHAYVEQEIKRCRTLVNPFGRRHIFFGRIGLELFKEAYAFLPQSTVSDVNKKALKRLYKHYIVLLELHDGLILSVPKGEVHFAIEALREAYDIPFQIWGETHTIPIEVSVGQNWAEMEEVE